MANIVITKSGNSIIVDFGDYYSSDNVDNENASYRVYDIVEVGYNADRVVIMMRNAHGIRSWDVTWDSTYTGSDYFIIDLVETVAPTSQLDLFDKITALRG